MNQFHDEHEEIENEMNDFEQEMEEIETEMEDFGAEIEAEIEGAMEAAERGLNAALSGLDNASNRKSVV